MSDSWSALVVLAIGAVTLYILYRRKGGQPPPGRRPDGSGGPAVVAGPAARPAATVAAGPRAAATAGAGSVGGQRADAAAGAALLLRKIRADEFAGSRVCVAWEALHDGAQWLSQGRETLARLAFTSDVYLMCRIRDESDKRAVLALARTVEGLQRRKVLFCTTHKGYEAFTRQVSPALLITTDPQQASFLSGVLPYILLVGAAETVAKPNVACVPSVAALHE